MRSDSQVIEKPKSLWGVRQRQPRDKKGQEAPREKEGAIKQRSWATGEEAGGTVGLPSRTCSHVADSAAEVAENKLRPSPGPSVFTLDIPCTGTHH